MLSEHPKGRISDLQAEKSREPEEGEWMNVDEAVIFEESECSSRKIRVAEENQMKTVRWKKKTDSHSCFAPFIAFQEKSRNYFIEQWKLSIFASNQ